MIPQTTLRKALADPKLLGSALGGDSWLPWRALLLAAMGEKLEPDELAHFRRLTQRQAPPTKRVKELWCVIGRRGGKSSAIAALAVYLAALCKWPMLSRGERGWILVVAADRDQAGVILNYARAILNDSPLLRQLVKRDDAEEIALTNGISIAVRTASFRRLRGFTSCAVVCDELGYWFGEDHSSNPDTEILAAARPTLLTTSGPLICISSPHARKGALWDAYNRYFGADGPADILVAQGASRDLHASLPQEVIDREFEKDAARASAEYGAEFRTDVESFVSLEVINACTDDVAERGYERTRNYYGFVDPSGGSSDSFTLCIAHAEDDVFVVDCIREAIPPFLPSDVVEEFAKVLKQYSVTTVEGDRYAGEWPVEAFSRHGISY
jgi:hypothetical protein